MLTPAEQSQRATFLTGWKQNIALWMIGPKNPHDG
jgi:hypothetical protein